MINSKLLKIIELLRKEEFKQFDLFLRSPYFNNGKQSEDVKKLWQYLCQQISRRQKGVFEKSKVYGIIFPQEAPITQKLEKLMSRLTLLLTNFIIQQQERDEKSNLLALSSFFGERKAHGLFNQSIKKFRVTQKKDSARNVNSYYQNYLLERQINKFQSLYNDRKTDVNLPAIHQSLDIYYLICKLEHATQLLANHLFLVPTDLGESLVTLDYLLPHIEERYLNQPVIQLYYRAFKLLKNYHQEEDDDYLNFNELLNAHGQKVSEMQRKALQAINRSYCVSKYLKGDRSYLPKAFALYQNHLSQGWLYYESKLLPGSLFNIVIVGLRLGQFEWVYQFLQNHRDRIAGTDTPEIILNYNLAHYYFYLQQYDQALEHLEDTYEDRYYKMAARRLEIQIHYEQNSVLLPAKIDAFKIYIYRMVEKPISAKQRSRNSNFIDILRQIIAPKTLHNHKRIEKIKQRIMSIDFLAEKEWLLKKLEDAQ